MADRVRLLFSEQESVILPVEERADRGMSLYWVGLESHPGRHGWLVEGGDLGRLCDMLAQVQGVELSVTEFHWFRTQSTEEGKVSVYGIVV